MHAFCGLSQGRANTATKYNIEEDGIMSFALSCLCPACTLVQVVNQARHDPTRYLPAISPLSPRHLPTALGPRPSHVLTHS